MNLFENLPLTAKLSGSIVLAAGLGGAISIAAGSALRALHGMQPIGGYVWLAVVVASVALLVALGLLLVRCIVHPLDEVRQAAGDLARIDIATLAEGMTALAQGDFTQRAGTGAAAPRYRSRDAIGETAEMVRTIMARVRDTIAAYDIARIELQSLIGEIAHASSQVVLEAEQLSKGTGHVGAASTHIADAIREVAVGTQTQAAALSKVEQEIEAMRGALNLTTGGVEAATTAAGAAAATATQGGHAVTQTIESIEAVRGAVLNSATQVHALGERSAQIGQIVEVIDDLADQTTLLALNAAIEAARAGAQGAGFSVVAAEVRRLAQRARSETQQITAHIQNIQRHVATVVTAMEAGTGAVQTSVALGGQARTALQDMLDVVATTDVQVQAIGQATAGMAERVGAVDAAVQQVTAVASQAAASAHEVRRLTEEQTASTGTMAHGAQHLTALTADLQQRVRRFVLDRDNRHHGSDEHVVAALAMRVAHGLGLEADQEDLVGRAGRLRDVGKIAVPLAVLQKSGSLSAEDWAIMRQHPALGAEVVSRVPALRALAPVIRAHHERWDGTGYPDGLAGTAIPLAARILAVAEAFTAMTTDRPHRPAWDAERAVGELRNCAGTQFDSGVVAALERTVAAEAADADAGHAA